ncbi:peptide-methionine (R)-S-oxide reductase [Pedobacter sp. UYP30]|uniref:peptide-methionine (R)-S-oxide reductase n=1 Tax=Pedobacter sp. UYP30 TaxID=1756400 RepID=UPI0033922E49
MKAILKRLIVFGGVLVIGTFSACAQNPTGKLPAVIKNKAHYNKLNAASTQSMLHEGTEAPGSGNLLHNKKKGTYICKQCNEPLFRSETKFESHTGWPSFDDVIKGGVIYKTDADGQRKEDVCANCGAHLGHVFYGEHFTKKNTRNCINSVALNFVADK